ADRKARGQVACPVRGVDGRHEGRVGPRGLTRTGRSGRWGPYRQASPPPARHRPGARSARRPRGHSTLSQTTCAREGPVATARPGFRCRPRLEALEDRLAPSADMVLQWNGLARDAIRTAGTPAPAASRILAIMHAAVYDAVNALDRTHEVYLVDALAHPQA